MYGLFDQVTLNIVSRPVLTLHWDNFHRVISRSTYPFLTYNVTTADTLRNAVTMTFDRLTLNDCSVSDITWSNNVLNFSEIEQSAAELSRFKYV